MGWRGGLKAAAYILWKLWPDFLRLLNNGIKKRGKKYSHPH